MWEWREGKQKVIRYEPSYSLYRFVGPTYRSITNLNIKRND
jgi:hypothetical protein